MKKNKDIEYKENNSELLDTWIAEVLSVKLGKPISRGSVKDFMDNRELIREASISNSFHNNIPRTTKYEKLDVKLKIGFDVVENKGGFVSDTLLQTKARELYKQLYSKAEEISLIEDTEFKA